MRDKAALLGKARACSDLSHRGKAAQNTTSFPFDFLIIGAALSNYRYKLFSIFHEIDLYPVRFDLDDVIQAEISRDYKFEYVLTMVGKLGTRWQIQKRSF